MRIPAALAVLAVATACSGTPVGTSDDPREAATEAYAASCDDLHVWATQRFIDTTSTCGDGGGTVAPGDVIVEFTDLVDNDSHEATVTLTATQRGAPALFSVHLILDDGLWKVDEQLE